MSYTLTPRIQCYSKQRDEKDKWKSNKKRGDGGTKAGLGDISFSCRFSNVPIRDSHITDDAIRQR